MHRGEKIDHLPFGIEPDEVEPVYTTLPGWPGDLTGIRILDEVPQTLLDYVAFIEEAVGVPVTVLSVGPDREQTLTLKAPNPSDDLLVQEASLATARRLWRKPCSPTSTRKTSRPSTWTATT